MSAKEQIAKLNNESNLSREHRDKVIAEHDKFAESINLKVDDIRAKCDHIYRTTPHHFRLECDECGATFEGKLIER